jgi:hypothetical protein
MTITDPATPTSPADPTTPTVWRRHGKLLGVVGLAVALLVGGIVGATAVTTSHDAGIVSTPAPLVPATTDAQVCGDLARVGAGFYNGYFSAMMIAGREGRLASTNADPITLAAQLGALTTVGAPANQIDGSDAIAHASPAVASAMFSMVKDADRIAQSAANTAVTGLALVNDISPVITSFSKALVACSQAGYQPTYFDPHALLGR